MSNREKVVYISGRYTAPTLEARQRNIDDAMRVAAQVWDMGLTALCPHGNTANLEEKVGQTGYEDFLAGDYELLRRSDVVLMLPLWESSRGAKLERGYAETIGKPIKYSLRELAEWMYQGGHATPLLFKDDGTINDFDAGDEI